MRVPVAGRAAFPSEEHPCRDANGALIVGAGSGLSASLAGRAAREGMDVVLAARDTQKLAALAGETGAATIACDASQAGDVERLFAAIDAGGERLDLVIYNASGRARGPVTEP